MIKKIFAIFIFAVACALQPMDAKERIDSLLEVLDYEIAHKDSYAQNKRNRIAQLYVRLHQAATPESLYQSNKDLFKEYRDFNMDTALYHARESKRIAKQMDDTTKYWESILMEAEGLKNLGLYNESFAVLESLPQQARQEIHVEILERYVSNYNSLVLSLPKEDSQRYYNEMMLCRDTLQRIAPNEIGRAINKIEYLKLKGDYKGALKVYEGYTTQDTATNAVFDFIVGDAYVNAGNVDKGLKYLLRTAIRDIRTADRKYNALPYIAQILFERGDIRRAYHYMLCSLSDFSIAKAQCRMSSVTDGLPTISVAYYAYRHEIEKSQRITTFLVICLAVVLILGVVYIIWQNRRLSEEKEVLSVSNGRLETMMEKSDARNEKLENSARTKEDYIGQLFNLCSEYINIMTKEHTSVLRIIKKGNLGEVERAVSKLESPDRLTSFYHKFDQIFLDIFPDFIEKFNALFDEHNQYDTSMKNLTPELRIFALIRLGVTDTSKIGAFLHYTNQTVYNYRFRMSSRAKNKATFFDDVAQL